ncbi:MAG: HD domain-containing protein [Candidatus Moranbacteria bacterium]|nr:HD domain-containing protein [Candidatus Moranbacteria bacterium]
MITKIPKQVIEVLQKIEEQNFEAYIVGGCVRDLIMDKIPNDWDVTTNATPEKIQEIFPDNFYENNFGTVGVKVEKFTEGEGEHDVVEVTTYRIESKYSDKRRPDEVAFAKTLQEDLSRRDFTMNALALRITHNVERETQIKKRSTVHDPRFEIVDLYDGQKDIEQKIIRTVGNAEERFDEDALRMMRAIRFHSQLGFAIEEKTLQAIKKFAGHMQHISQERIKDELVKIILSDNPAEGIEMLHETGLLQFVIPELESGVGIAQNRHHIHTIYKHCVLALQFCPSKKMEVRLASLLHDIAKPQTKRGEGEFATFYNHDHVGARVARKILQRLRFSNEIIEKVSMLVDNHMFYYNPEEVGESSVRRLIQKVGLENMKDLIDVRIADRLGSGTPKAKPYKLRHLEYMIDKLSQDAVSVKMLKINGRDLMQDLGMTPGPKIGAILDVLLSEVIEDAAKNEKEFLLTRAKELDQEDLQKLREMAKEKIEEKKEEDDKEIRDKHWVK